MKRTLLIGKGRMCYSGLKHECMYVCECILPVQGYCDEVSLCLCPPLKTVEVLGA